MKAERRHELKTNALARNLENAPQFFQKFGSRILLGVILCVLAYVLVHNYTTSKAIKAQRAAENLGEAVFRIGELRQATAAHRDPRELVKMRQSVEEAANSAIEADDPKLRAQAYVLKGDANWIAANTPPAPGSTTRPELKADKTSEEFLTAASTAYNAVLATPGVDTQSLTAARLGLAAIAQNRGQPDKAREFYQQIIDDPSSSKATAEVAHELIDESKAMGSPVFLSSPSEMWQMSSSRPAAVPFGPTPLPGSIPPPFTQPVVPSAPSTAPAGPVISAPTTRPSNQ